MIRLNWFGARATPEATDTTAIDAAAASASAAAAARLADLHSQMAAIDKVLAVIEFDPDGTIKHANDNFLKTLGFTLAEIKGKHHTLFVDAAQRESPAYRQFWDKLGRGDHDAGQYKRIAKDGREIWIQASYNPILGADGKPFKVVEYATDITAQRLKSADSAGQLAAIDKVLAVIEFKLDGTILRVNDRFGHAGGDEVLKAVAKALGRGLRTGDLLGRFGGEEFCILLPDATLEQALAIGERLRADIESNAGSAVRHLAETRITMSFGVEQLSGDVPQFAPLSNRADQALYHSKQNGRNRVTAWGHMPVG